MWTSLGLGNEDNTCVDGWPASQPGLQTLCGPWHYQEATAKRNASLILNLGDKRLICLFFGQFGAVSDDEERGPGGDGRNACVKLSLTQGAVILALLAC